MAQYLHAKGLADVKAVYLIWICASQRHRMLQAYGSCNARVAVVLDASQAPSTIPPLRP